MAISVLLFFTLLSLALGVIKMQSGMISFGAVMALIGFGLLEMAFILFVFDFYGKSKAWSGLLRRFCLVTAVLFFLLSGTVALRFLVLLPAFREAGLSAAHILVSRDYIQGIGGIVLGTLLLIAPRLLRRVT